MSINNSVVQNQRSIITPLLITGVFGIISSYIMFFHHDYWFEFDGLLYFETGLQIIDGKGINVKQFDTPIGGPVIYGLFDLIINNGFLTMKLFSVLSCTGIVFFSYFLTKNIFDRKIALFTQLLIAVNAQVFWLSTHLMNDAFPFFLITVSLYFVTKKQIQKFDLVIIGALLGIASMIRAQALPVSLAIFIFLIINKNQTKNKIKNVSIFIIVFLIFFSPLLIYNYSTHGTLSDSNPNLALSRLNDQTLEVHEKLKIAVLEGQSFNPFLDIGYFSEKYIENLLFVNPSLLFNFFQFDNMSPIPIIPFIGMIPVFGGLIYCSNYNISRKTAIITLVVFSTSLIIISFYNFEKYFFGIIIFTILTFGVLQIKKFKENFLPLLILSHIFFLVVSIASLGRGYQMFPVIFTTSILCSIFFVDLIPKIILKVKKTKTIEGKNLSKVGIIFMAIIISINIGYSYKVLEYSLYDDVKIDEGIEVFEIFQKDELKQRGWEYKVIGEILAKEDNIEEKYVMSDHNAYSYYSGAKYVHTQFHEGGIGNTLNEFVLRNDWSDYDRFVSNLHSIPMDRHDKFVPKPSYLIYEPQVYHSDLMKIDRAEELNRILADPQNPKIPKNFEVLYHSEETKRILYKINPK